MPKTATEPKPTYQNREARVIFQRVITDATHGDMVPDLYRARAPGGWLVVLGRQGGSLTYVPDPAGRWLPELKAAEVFVEEEKKAPAAILTKKKVSAKKKPPHVHKRKT